MKRDRSTMQSSSSSEHVNRNERVSLHVLTSDNLPLFKKLNSGIFPIPYTGAFYKSLLVPAQLLYRDENSSLCDLQLNKIAIYTPQNCEKRCFAVGGIACRIETLNVDNDKQQQKHQQSAFSVHLLILGVDVKYRNRGVGSLLMEDLISQVQTVRSIRAIFLHVCVDNSDAIAFYEKFGFEKVKRVKNYYPRLDQPDCYILQKQIYDHQNVDEETKQKSHLKCCTLDRKSS